MLTCRLGELNLYAFMVAAWFLVVVVVSVWTGCAWILVDVFCSAVCVAAEPASSAVDVVVAAVVVVVALSLASTRNSSGRLWPEQRSLRAEAVFGLRDASCSRRPDEPPSPLPPRQVNSSQAGPLSGQGRAVEPRSVCGMG